MSSTNELNQRLNKAQQILGALGQTDVDLGGVTTYRVGGKTALFVKASSEDDLQKIAEVRLRTGLPVLVIGKGSNLLVADQGFPGLTVALGKEFEGMEIDARGGRINVGGNAALPVVARKTVAEELAGFEWAVGVPGSIGGAVRMNAGGHGGDMAASVEAVRIFDLEKSAYEIRLPSELAFAYRQSRIKPSEIVVGATLKLAFGERSAGEELLTEIVQWRRENQPGGQNAGSVFVNPDGESAGSLIEKLGLKGLRVGSASVSDKHANFFQVDPGGSANDVNELMNQVADRVYAEAGVSLKTEIQRVGF